MRSYAVLSLAMMPFATTRAFVLPRCSPRLEQLLVRSATTIPQTPAAPSSTTNSRGQFPLIEPVFDEVCEMSGVTLTRYMMEVSRANPHLKEVESLMNSIQTACKTISSLVNRACITKMTGYQDDGCSINVQGEQQKKLDVLTNDVLKKALRFTGRLTVLASEEEDAPVTMEDRERIYADKRDSDVVVEEGNKYVACFDPLDGSSNVDASIPVGTIFGIFANGDEKECLLDDEDLEGGAMDPESRAAKCLMSTLQPGTNLVAAGYCLYSSSTHLVFTLGKGVNGFTYDTHIGEFVLTHPNIRIPERGQIYSFNEANRWDWDKPMQEYVTALQMGQGESGKRYSSRYIGSMVGDVHRTLLYGGIFGYPADANNKDGKLRLLYEAAPMAFLVEQAGGLALTGKNRIMEIRPRGVHQRVPCILGSREDVEELRSFYNASKDPDLIRRCIERLNSASS